MPFSRATFVRFLLGLLLGIAAGLIYGWLFQPVEYVNTTPESLREDFQVDFVLMLAEAYPGQGDLDWVSQHLALLGPTQADELVQWAEGYARQHNYGAVDIRRIDQLGSALSAQGGSPQIEGP